LYFAPLIAHIFGGSPEPTILKEKLLGWRQNILHFNPTSIYWRYYTITFDDLELASGVEWKQFPQTPSSGMEQNGTVPKK
jgi:hypothetical protein